MISSACDLCGRKSYGVHHHHMPAHWQQWSGKIIKIQEWLKWPAYFDNINTISLLPYGSVSQLSRNYPGSASNSKTLCPTLRLYGPVSQLLEVSIPLLEGGNVVGTHHELSCGFTHVTMERTWGSGMENPPQPCRRCMWVTRGVNPGKWQLQFPVRSLSKQQPTPSQLPTAL